MVFPSPVVKPFETRVELDIMAQKIKTLIVRGRDAIEHLEEAVAETDPVGHHFFIELLTTLGAETEIVHEIVIAVIRGNSAVKVGEKNKPWAFGKCRNMGSAHDDLVKSITVREGEMEGISTLCDGKMATCGY